MPNNITHAMRREAMEFTVEILTSPNASWPNTDAVIRTAEKIADFLAGNNDQEAEK